MRILKLLVGAALLFAVTFTLIGCADSAYQQNIQKRQAAIAAMPNGSAKFYEQSRLDNELLVNKVLEQQRFAAAGAIIASGMANAGATYSAGAYTNPYTFQNMQAARPSTVGTYLNPLQVQLRH